MCSIASTSPVPDLQSLSAALPETVKRRDPVPREGGDEKMGERVTEPVPAEVSAPVPAPVLELPSAPQPEDGLPVESQTSAPQPEQRLPVKSQTSGGREGKPAPGKSVDEKTTSRGRKKREEASKETAPKEKSRGKTATAPAEAPAPAHEPAPVPESTPVEEPAPTPEPAPVAAPALAPVPELAPAPAPVSVPVPAPVLELPSAPQPEDGLPVESQTSAPQPEQRLPVESQTSGGREGKPAPGGGGDEKITSRGRKKREEASKETAPIEKSGGKTAAEDQATREKGAKELARLNQKADMLIEAAQRKMITDFFSQQNAGQRELLQREALPDEEFKAEVERLGQIKEVKDRMLEAAKKIGRSIGVSIREGVENAGRGECLFETVSSQILERKSEDGRKFQFLINKYGKDFFTPKNLRAGTVALLENNPHALQYFNWTPEGLGSQETLSPEQRRAEFQKQLEALKKDGQYAYAAGDLLLPGLSAYLGLNITLIGTSAQTSPLTLFRPKVLGGDESLCIITPPILLAFDDMALHYEDFWPEDEKSESMLMAATRRVMEGGQWPQTSEAQETTRQGTSGATSQTTSSAATSSTEKAAAEKVAPERAAAERTQEEKAAVEKAAREKAGAERVAAEKIQEEKATVEKATAEEAARKKAAAERIGAKKAQEVEKAGTAEEAATEKTAAGGIVEKKALAEKSRTTPRATTSVSKRKTVALGRITVYKFNNPGFSYLCWINHPTQVLLLSTKADLERELLDVTEQPPHLPETRNLVKILLEIFTKAEEVQNLDRLRKILQASGLKVKTDGTGAALECFRTLVKTLKKEAPGSVQQFESITKLMHIGGPCPTEGCNGSILSNTVVKKKDIVIIDHKRFCDGQHIQHAINRYTKGSERGRKCTNNCSVKIKKKVEFTKTPELFLVEVHDQRVRTTAMEVMLGGFRYHPIAVVHHLPPSGPDGIGHHFSSLFDEKRNQWWRINDYGRENWRQAVDNLEDVFNYLGFLVYKKDSPQPHADWSPSPLPLPPSPPASQPGPVIDLTQDLSSCSPSTTSTSITG